MTEAGPSFILDETPLFPGISPSMLAFLSAQAQIIRDAGHELSVGMGASIDGMSPTLRAHADGLVENGLLYSGHLESGRPAIFFTLYGLEAVAAIDAMRDFPNG